ncbi:MULTISPECIES: hypothetical protein [Providencia]|uniref:hypothetical protein n=1 Tax=Providencia TaxID=586 RepID=UPI00065E0067|nr:MULTISPECIES: hypothetical protein [Providencia]
MKKYSIPISNENIDMFFKPLRKKTDIIILLMNTIKYVISYVNVSTRTNSSIDIIIDDMNRFIYKSENKIFSIRSPFSIREDEGKLIFYSKNIPEITSTISSKIIAFSNDYRFNSSSWGGFIELLDELFTDADSVWLLIQELMLFEDGYLRYDHDPEHESGRIHPLYHLDIYYTTASTFKIGTYHKPCPFYFTELLNNNIEAKFLEKK